MKTSADIKRETLPPFADGISSWFNLETENIYQRLAERCDMELQEVSVRFGELRLRINTDNRWSYHPMLGVYEELD